LILHQTIKLKRQVEKQEETIEQQDERDKCHADWEISKLSAMLPGSLPTLSTMAI